MTCGSELRGLLAEAWQEMGAEVRNGVLAFYSELLRESEVQNLTRLTAPQDFLDGHLTDARVLLESGLVSFPAMDLGSGCGVPGLLAAVLEENGQWVLAESEGRKADFLERTTNALGLQGRVRVFRGRGELCLREFAVGSVVARAVGPVSRIFAWIEKCSTWNSLVLMKGPRWEEEWADFQRNYRGSPLKVAAQHEYTVGREAKKRVIIRLERVPRGTKTKNQSSPRGATEYSG